ncbi:MAG TPA: WG repeat-containing protein [Micromonosporaceae bacterium]
MAPTSPPAPPVSAPPVSAPPAEDRPETGDLALPDAPAPPKPRTGSDDDEHLPAQKSTPDGTLPDEPSALPDHTDDGEAAGAGPAAPPQPPDPEQVLSSYAWRLSAETLHEVVEDPDELRTLRDRLTEKVGRASDNASRARLLGLRAVVSRLLGDLGKALADGKLALAHAEATGELRRIAITQARLANVLHRRGDLAEADRLFAEANSPELPDRLRGTIHEHAGRCCYDRGRYIEACDHLSRALALRKVEDPDLTARVAVVLDAVLAKVATGGWGPYARSRDEILGVRRPPVPRLNETFRRWGYVDGDGKAVIPPTYADAQRFAEGVAWVRRPDNPRWELIDEAGKVLIEASAGYRAVRPFSDGLAWVSRDGAGPWGAIDTSNKVVVAAGYEDVRAFRRGVAAVRRGGWGAVDRRGRVVVPTRYAGFATRLTDGHHVDGFTDEGLAVVDAGGGRGVVDRHGKVIVAPTHAAVVIHPVAFLVGDGAGRWGALDRRGEPLVEVVHRSRSDVTEEIDRLLADTEPVL